MGFGFLVPIAKVALRAVLGAVLNAEAVFGGGKGDEKLSNATDATTAILNGSFDVSKVAGAIDEVVTLVKAVVEVLNALGLLDDEPGMDVDYQRLIPGVKAVFTAIAELAEALA